MLTTLDHILVTAQDCRDATDRFCALLAREPTARHAKPGSGRVRFQLGNTALDLAAADLGGSAEAAPLAIGFATPDLAKTRHKIDRVGIPTTDSPPIRLTGESGDVESPIATLSSAFTYGPTLLLVEQNSAAAQSAFHCDPRAAISGLDHVVITTSHPERAAALYGARLGLEMKLDRTNPAWDARLMFFKCGDSIVEIAHSLKNANPAAPDRVWGISWRANDVAAANARMAAEGFSVSEVRTGRKPGTLVFSVRDAPAGVPTLVIGPDLQRDPKT